MYKSHYNDSVPNAYIRLNFSCTRRQRRAEDTAFWRALPHIATASFISSSVSPICMSSAGCKLACPFIHYFSCLYWLNDTWFTSAIIVKHSSWGAFWSSPKIEIEVRVVLFLKSHGWGPLHNQLGSKLLKDGSKALLYSYFFQISRCKHSLQVYLKQSTLVRGKSPVPNMSLWMCYALGQWPVPLFYQGKLNGSLAASCSTWSMVGRNIQPSRAVFWEGPDTGRTGVLPRKISPHVGHCVTSTPHMHVSMIFQAYAHLWCIMVRGMLSHSICRRKRGYHSNWAADSRSMAKPDWDSKIKTFGLQCSSQLAHDRRLGAVEQAVAK